MVVEKFSIVRCHLAMRGLDQNFFRRIVESGSHRNSLQMILHARLTQIRETESLGKSQLLLGRDLQEREGSSPNELDVRAQDSARRDGRLRVYAREWPVLCALR